MNLQEINAELLDALKVVMLACPEKCSDMVLTGHTKTVGEIFRTACDLAKQGYEWVDATKQLPDDDVCVLIALEDGEVWTGYVGW